MLLSSSMLSSTLLYYMYSQATSLMWLTVRTESPRSLTFMPVRTIAVAYSMIWLWSDGDVGWYDEYDAGDDNDGVWYHYEVMGNGVIDRWCWSIWWPAPPLHCVVWYIPWRMIISTDVVISCIVCHLLCLYLSFHAYHDRQAKLYQLSYFTLAVIR